MMVDGTACLCVLGTLFLIITAVRLAYSAKKYGIANKSNTENYNRDMGTRL